MLRGRLMCMLTSLRVRLGFYCTYTKANVIQKKVGYIVIHLPSQHQCLSSKPIFPKAFSLFPMYYIYFSFLFYVDHKIRLQKFLRAIFI